MNWENIIKNEDFGYWEDEETGEPIRNFDYGGKNESLIIINQAIKIAMRTNKMIRNSKSSEISKADRNLLESSSHTLNKAKERLDKMINMG